MPGRDIVVLGIIPWDERWQRPHHFSAQLAARGHRVVYVEPQLLGSGGVWARRRESTLPEGVEQVALGSASGLQVNVSPVWPDEDVTAAAFSFWTLVGDLSLEAPTLLVQTPAWGPLVRALLEESDLPLVYDCLDEHTGWFPEAATSWRREEEWLAAQARLVLASATLLEERMREHAWQVLRVPNGCIVEHFAGADAPTGQLRERHDGPIVGYHGAIAQWLDTALVADLAELRPDWTIVLVGPYDDAARTALGGIPNVELVGQVPYAELPRWTADFHVGLIPFLVGDLSASTDPVKLWEYFAAGKPVVATPMLELYPFQGLLRIEEDAAGFARAIDAALAGPGDAAARRALAGRATWTARVDAFHPELLACRPAVDVGLVRADGEPRGVALGRLGRTEVEHLALQGSGVAEVLQAVLQRGEAEIVAVVGEDAILAERGLWPMIGRLLSGRDVQAVAAEEGTLGPGPSVLVARRETVEAIAARDAAGDVLPALLEVADPLAGVLRGSL